MDDHYPIRPEQEDFMLTMFHACKKATDDLYKNVTPHQKKFYKERLRYHIENMNQVNKEMTMGELKLELIDFLARDLTKI